MAIGCTYVKKEEIKDSIKLIFDWPQLVWKYPLVENTFRLSIVGPFDNPSFSSVASRTETFKLMMEAQEIKVKNK